MAHAFTDVLSQEELNYLTSAPEVQAAKASIDTRESGQVYFSMQIPATIHQKLQGRLGLTLPTTVPMRWVKGDTAPHVDVGPRSFETTHLMYLTDNEGELIVNGTRYPINCGSAYTFSEGLNHETVNTGSVPRLLLGPMSERGLVVGATLPPGCCPDPVQLIGLSYSVRNDITAGSIISQTPPPRFSSYSAYYQMIMAKSTRK
jgi:hypothetical protein